MESWSPGHSHNLNNQGRTPEPREKDQRKLCPGQTLRDISVRLGPLRVYCDKLQTIRLVREENHDRDKVAIR